MDRALEAPAGDLSEAGLALDLAAADRKLIKEIDDAIKRVDNGTFGICELTGKPIKAERLEELPWARYTIEAARELAGAGAVVFSVDGQARALVLAEAQGLVSHGLSRVSQYSGQLRTGRVNGAAHAQVLRRKGGALLVDAQEGLAFPACELAIREAITAAREHGVAFAGVTNSHHCGVVVDHLRLAAAAGGELWITDSAGHIGSYRAEPTAYTTRVLGFFAQHLA